MTTVEEAVRVFRDAAMKKGDFAIGKEDARLYAQMAKAVGVLHGFGSAGTDALKLLAHDGSPHVRSWAATELLALGDTSVLRVIEDLANHGSPLGLSAQIVVEQHRLGELRSPFKTAL